EAGSPVAQSEGHVSPSPSIVTFGSPSASRPSTQSGASAHQAHMQDASANHPVWSSGSRVIGQPGGSVRGTPPNSSTAIARLIPHPLRAESTLFAWALASAILAGCGRTELSVPPRVDDAPGAVSPMLAVGFFHSCALDR